MNCDPIARAYRWLEYCAFGRELERRRFRYLPEVSQARKALLLGDGDGRFLARLAGQNPNAEIDYIDSSPRMLDLAGIRLPIARARYRCGDALSVVLPKASYDLIATHFFLDCFNEQEMAVLINRVAAAAAPGTQWLVSEFREAEEGFGRIWGRAWVQILYAFFGLATGLSTRTLVDHRPFLRQRGFRLQYEERSWLGLLVSELWVLDTTL